MSNTKINITENIREKILNRNFKLSTSERLEVEVLYLLIAKRKLARGCKDCLGTAYKVITNYMSYHEPRKKTVVEKETKVTKVVVKQKDDQRRAELMEWKLPELREMYPHIKAISKIDFINQLLADA